MKLLFILITALLITSCSSPVKYTDFAMPEGFKAGDKSKENLTKDEVYFDKMMLLKALKRGYGGRFVVDKKILNSVKENIRRIKGPIKTQEFCNLVGAELDKVPDYHLHIRYNGKKCTSIVRKKASVGQSLSVKRNKLWIVEKMRRSGKKVLYISIKKFPSHTSPKWNGFLDKMKKVHPWSDTIIFDLRGNTGGDDTIGYEISKYLHKTDQGFDFPTPYL
ncbi:MAG: S41 family peptidase [Bdellovibrionales bacterium]